MIQKILIISATLVALIQNVNAVSYNYSTTFDIPPVIQNENDPIYTVTTPYQAWFSNSYQLDGWLGFDSDYYQSTTLFRLQANHSLNEYVAFDQQFYFDFGCNINYCWYNRADLFIYATSHSGWLQLSYELTNQNCPNQYACNPTDSVESGLLYDVPDNCVWLTSDCIFVVRPNYILKHTLIGGKLYLAYVDIYFYHNNQKLSYVHRKFFGSLTDENLTDIDSYFWAFTDLFSFAPNSYWTPFSIGNNLYSFYTYTNNWTGLTSVWFKKAWSFLDDYREQALTNYLGKPRDILLQAYLSDWLGSDGWVLWQSDAPNMYDIQCPAGDTTCNLSNNFGYNSLSEITKFSWEHPKFSSCTSDLSIENTLLLSFNFFRLLLPYDSVVSQYCTFDGVKSAPPNNVPYFNFFDNLFIFILLSVLAYSFYRK